MLTDRKEHVMNISEYSGFERKLAYHTAPTLLGIKCGGLISLEKSERNLDENIAAFNRRAAARGLEIKKLCGCKNRVLMLIYSEKMLAEQLSKAEYRAILERYGYGDCMTVDSAIDRLAKRIECSDSTEQFPHEIGVFLGYPAEDVVGFIENEGLNFTLCGYWKVYGDTEKAKRTFGNYDKCRKFLCNKLNQGCDIYQALRIS
jgi:hypothetical protein